MTECILKQNRLSGRSLVKIFHVIVVALHGILSYENERYSCSFFLDVCPLIENVLSEETFEFPLHCSMKCLQDPLCAGYNFKSKRKKNNCQFTHTLHHNFHDCNADDKGWIFYHPVAPRKVKTIIRIIYHSRAHEQSVHFLLKAPYLQDVFDSGQFLTW